MMTENMYIYERKMACSILGTQEFEKVAGIKRQ